MHLGPYDSTHDLEHCFSEEQRDAVDKLNLYKRRVVIWIGDPRLPPKLIQALMGHELRHAEQFAADETVYRLGIMTLESLARVYAGTGAGATSIRRFTPQEADANAAATQLVAPAGDAGEARNGEHRPLVTATDPLRPLGELGLRTLAFAALHPEAFVAEAQCRRVDASTPGNRGCAAPVGRPRSPAPVALLLELVVVVAWTVLTRSALPGQGRDGCDSSG